MYVIEILVWRDSGYKVSEDIAEKGMLIDKNINYNSEIIVLIL
jgi:hypothetical protein